MKISWKADGIFWEVAEETRSAWLLWAAKEPEVTPLHLWKGLGFLRFVAPIVGLPLSALADLTRAQTAIFLSVPLAVRRDYTRRQPDLAVLATAVRENSALILRMSFQERHRRSHLKGAGRTTYAVVDATLRHESYCLCYSSRGMPSSATLHFGKPRIRRTDDDPLLKLRKDSGAFDILDAEAGAMTWLILDWAAESEEGDILIPIGDNQPVLRSLHTALAKHEGVSTNIASIEHLLTSRRIVFTDIASAENYGDIGSRPHDPFSDEEVSFRRNKSIARLVEAAHEYSNHGTTLLMRRVKTDEELPEVPDDDADDDEEEDSDCPPRTKERTE